MANTTQDRTEHEKVGGTPTLVAAANQAKPRAKNKETKMRAQKQAKATKYTAPQFPKFTKKQREVFEQALLDADSVEEVIDLYRGAFEISEEHALFLAAYEDYPQFGGIAKLREAYYEVFSYDGEHETLTSSFISETTYKQLAKDDPRAFSSIENVDLGVKHRASLTRAIVDSFTNAVRLLKLKGINPEDASLFDLGTGTGKPILIGLSKEFNFKSGTGVDYFEPVLIDARNNAEKLKANGKIAKDKKVDFIHADATLFKDFNGVNVVYIYNPFDADVMKRVEQNLRKHAGKAIVIYNKPLHGQSFKDKGWTLEHTQNMEKDENGNPIFDPDLQTEIYSYGFENNGNATSTPALASPQAA